MLQDISVALFTRAWIEILSAETYLCIVLVALFTRAWIEIEKPHNKAKNKHVALFTRAWIEIADGLAVRVVYGCRPLHEGVD